MAFLKIDDTIIASDRPLSTVVPQRIDGNNRAAWNKRGKRFAYGWDYQDAPEVSFYAANTTNPARACIPHIWPLSPGCTELTVKLRHNVSTASINVGVSAQHLRTSLGQPIAANIVESAATSSATEKTTSLTVDVSDYTDDSKRVDLLVCLTFYSNVTGGTDISDTAGTGTGVNSWDYRTIITDEGIAGGATQQDVYPHRVVNWGSTSGGSKDGAPFLGDPRQIIRIVNDSAATKDIWHVYPAFPNADATNVDSYWAEYEDLGNSSLKGVLIYESDFRVYETAAIASVPLECGQSLSSAPVRQTLYRPAENVYIDRTVIIACGPTTPDLTVTETGAATTALNKVSRLLDVPQSTSTYSVVGQWIAPVSPPFSFDGTNYARRVYRAQALFSIAIQRGIFIGGIRDEVRDPLEFEFRLRATDTDGSSNETTGNTSKLALAPVYNTAVDATAYANSMGLVLGFWRRTLSTSPYDARNLHARHTLMGFYPSDVWQDARHQLLKCTLRDDSGGARILYLEARLITPSSVLDDLLYLSGSKMFCPACTIDYTDTRDWRTLGD